MPRSGNTTTTRGARSGAADPLARALANRRRRARARLRDRGADTLLITSPKDIRYLTGFHGEDSWAILSPRSMTIISDSRFQEELEALVGVRVVIRTGPIERAAADALPSVGPVAIQAEHMTIATRAALARLVGARRLRSTTGLIAGLRAVKDETEIALIRRAVRIQERALLETLDGLEPGRREADIAAELEHRMKSLGAEGLAFSAIVAAGANGSKPHSRPGSTKTRANRTVLIDWGAVAGGYCGDMTRTFALGRWPRRLREVYEVVLEAHQAGVAAVAPGKNCAAVDAAARGVIERAGLGTQFGHGLGHGVGLDIHEAPRLARHSTDVLEAGMVVTIEPGVYLPGVGGVRIEDDVVVTARGRRTLSTLPKAIDWASR